MDKYCSFFGHGDFRESEDLECRIKSEIADCVENRKIYNFWLGGYGGYDSCCARYVKEMKDIYPQIKSYLVLAYIHNKMDDYDKEYIAKMFDGTIYPPLEKVPLRYAISKRNQWIVDNSDYIIFYVNYSWGGACKSFEYANKKHKDYINFGTKKEL
ncbi:MAG: DUF1273 domain-containing protein [Clostridia bacterium]|nr:DUF1273 domain-containing protein [Clostridia bacterium]